VAVSRYCLDTSAYSQFMRGEPVVTGLLDSAEWVGVPAIVIGELLSGFAQGRQASRNERELEEFLANPAVETLPVDRDVARFYSEIFTSLKASGTPLPINDVWVAATAARAGASVLTFDAHFSKINRVGSLILKAATRLR
jgi:predicted nucleic acid-binding protein